MEVSLSARREEPTFLELMESLRRNCRKHSDRIPEFQAQTIHPLNCTPSLRVRKPNEHKARPSAQSLTADSGMPKMRRRPSRPIRATSAPWWKHHFQT